jgi:hypothetical protein
MAGAYGRGLCHDVRCLFFAFDIGVLRCVESQTGLLYYIVLCGANLVSCAVFVPAAKSIFVYSQGAAGIFYSRDVAGIFASRAGNSPHELVYLIARQLCCTTARVLDWLIQQPTQFGTFMWPATVSHLGHVLWNECSGLEIVVNQLKQDEYPAVYNLPALAGGEFYGPLADLYPELRLTSHVTSGNRRTPAFCLCQRPAGLPNQQRPRFCGHPRSGHAASSGGPERSHARPAKRPQP